MGGSDVVMVSVKEPVPITELESGTYRLVDHRTKSEFRNLTDAKATLTQEFKNQISDLGIGEEVTINSIEIVQIPAGEIVKTGWIWRDTEVTVIPEAHTDIIFVFSVKSPLAIMTAVGIIIIVLGFGIVAGMLLSGVLAPLFKFLYENPLIVAAGLGILLLVLLVGAGFRAPRRDREE